ncbi:hypothetical protein [Sphingomonas jeddahensis]|uniref:TadE-like protein n=1 Tax=Sphingomonas jeddahensis TaxID=1915074 RepID=A0A1V2EV61_9SPHN|nr:hypothetical protein [Sphingomonas jeddahensis]ONF96069.1 hypothetical protein SPHI_16830 [Sphingomonas jeddahensis]
MELAFILPVLVLFILGMSDLAFAGASSYSLTRNANRAVELALSRGAVNGGYEYLRSEASAGSTSANVTVDYWLECNFVEQKDFTTDCPSGALPFRYVRVTVSDVYYPMFPAYLFGSTIDIGGSALVRVQ